MRLGQLRWLAAEAPSQVDTVTGQYMLEVAGVVES